MSPKEPKVFGCKGSKSSCVSLKGAVLLIPLGRGPCGNPQDLINPTFWTQLGQVYGVWIKHKFGFKTYHVSNNYGFSVIKWDMKIRMLNLDSYSRF